MFRDIDVLWTVRWIRVDAIAIVAAALWTMQVTHGSWAWFLGVLLAPDLSMLGYLFGSRAGAAIYNTGHMYLWPLALLTIGFASHGPMMTTVALSWIAHVALDQVVGYGLKLPSMFEQTLLGPIGRSRREGSGRSQRM
jgi:hypothetical protein